MQADTSASAWAGSATESSIHHRELNPHYLFLSHPLFCSQHKTENCVSKPSLPSPVIACSLLQQANGSPAMLRLSQRRRRPNCPRISSFSMRPPFSTHAKPCRDLPALDPHLLKRNLANRPTLRCFAYRSRWIHWRQCVSSAFRPLLPSLQRVPRPAGCSARPSIHPYMEHFLPAFQGKREPYIAVQDLGSIMQIDWIMSRAPGNSTPKLKQPSGPRQIVCGYGVVNHEPEADQVFVKAKRNRSSDRCEFLLYVACNPSQPRISQDRSVYIRDHRVAFASSADY